MATLKDKINRILGNNVRLLLPSYWWKKLFGAVVDEIESVEATANSVSKKVYSISGELRELTNDITSLSTDFDRKLSNKQDTLYSGNTIKTINGKSILGYGDIQIEDYTKTVTSKEALDDLEVRAGTIATVVSVDTSESATELSMSTCYKKPAGVSDYSLYNKLTPIRKVAIHVPSVNVSFNHMIQLIKGNSYDDSLFIIYDNGRVGYNIGNPGIRNLLVSDGQLIQSNIDALNDLLNSNDYRYYSTVSSQGYGSWSDVEACRDSWVKRISLVSDSYIKEEDWTRLLKEGDMVGGGHETLELTFGETEEDRSNNVKIYNKIVEAFNSDDINIPMISVGGTLVSNVTLSVSEGETTACLNFIADYISFKAIASLSLTKTGEVEVEEELEYSSYYYITSASSMVNFAKCVAAGLLPNVLYTDPRQGLVIADTFDSEGDNIILYFNLSKGRTKVVVSSETGEILSEEVVSSGADITIDSELSDTSENAVQNKVITAALNNKVDTISLSKVATSGSYNDLKDKPDGITRNTYLMPNNGFSGDSSFGISYLNNALYSADKRFVVESTGFSGGTDQLFDGNYEGGLTLAQGQTGTLTISNNGNNIIDGYPYGDIILSFYYNNIPESASVEVYCNYEPHGIGWKTLDLKSIEGSQKGIYKFTNGFFNITQVRVTVTAKADISTSLVEVD